VKEGACCRPPVFFWDKFFRVLTSLVEPNFELLSVIVAYND
jgi:hypothetical protein